MTKTRESGTGSAAHKAAVKMDSAAEAEVKNEAAKNNAAKNEAVKNEAAKNEAAKNETVKLAAAVPSEPVACPDLVEPGIEAAAELAESAILEAETIADRLLDSGLRGVAGHLDFLGALATAATPLDALRALEDYRARALDRAIEDSSSLAEASLRLATGRLAA